ncbi:MAG: hypothetical protein M3N91_11405 [Pseudomonadota bacterium]|nr:hypothetical protein [Pseudomonadota bacterium]
MNTPVNGGPGQENLTTADLAASANQAVPAREAKGPVFEVNTAGVTRTRKEEATLEPLFAHEAATDFRSRWDVVQRSFVDDPREAVRAGDELVTEVIKSLAATFAGQRSELEGVLNQTEKSSTENLRVALRRYRSFFERLPAM